MPAPQGQGDFDPSKVVLSPGVVTPIGLQPTPPSLPTLQDAKDAGGIRFNAQVLARLTMLEELQRCLNLGAFERMPQHLAANIMESDPNPEKGGT